MKYNVCEYLRITDNLSKLKSGNYGLTATELIKFIRHHNDAYDLLEITNYDDEEILQIDVDKKLYYRYYPYCDKSVYDYLNSLEKQIKKHGYLRGKKI